MRLVDNECVPDLRGEPSKHFGLFDEVDRRDGHRLDRPWIDIERQRAGACGKRPRIDAPSASMLNRCSSSSAHCWRRPGGVTMSARSHQPRCCSSDQHQPGLNRLAEADFVGEEKPRCACPRIEREGRLELKGKDVDGGPMRLREVRRRRAVPNLSMQVMHPAPPRHCAEF